MIYYNISFDSNKNIGACYNRVMDLLPNDSDWAAFFDSDTFCTTTDFGLVVDKAIEVYKDASAFTCYTNRVNCKWQIAPGVDKVSNCMEYHRSFGKSLQSKFYHESIDVTKQLRTEVMSGVFFALKKEAWQKCGPFPEEGMLGIDNFLHWRIMDTQQKLYLIRGMYIYHWYRNNGIEGKGHLKKS